MNNSTLKKRVFSGLIWKTMERICTQVVSFVISIVLARLLLPEDYGTVALVTIFVTIANAMVSSGLGQALVQKRDAGETDFSSMFWCSVAFSFLLYIIIFFTAPMIAIFYKNEELVNVLRVLALAVPIAGVNTIQHAYVSRHMLFKKFFFSTLIGTILSGMVGIIMAYCGMGVWALVAQYLMNATIDTMIIFLTIDWKPKLLFQFDCVKNMIPYGMNLLGANLINTLYEQLRSLVIGKQYSTSDLAYYNKGNSFPTLLETSIDGTISSVLFPALSNCNDDTQRVKDLTRKSMKTTSYLVSPVMFGLAVVAPSMIYLLLTDKWMDCVPYVRLSCFYFLWQPLQTANWQAIKAMGRSDLCFRYEVIKKGIGVAFIVIFAKVSVLAIAISGAAMGLIMFFINTTPNKRIIQYGFGEQMKDIVKPMVASLLMSFPVYLMSFLSLSPLILLVVQVVSGMVLYFIFSILLKIDSFYYLIGCMNEYLNKGKKDTDKM